MTQSIPHPFSERKTVGNVSVLTGTNETEAGIYALAEVEGDEKSFVAEGSMVPGSLDSAIAGALEKHATRH